MAYDDNIKKSRATKIWGMPMVENKNLVSIFPE